jgi:hypothetical protein
MLRRHLTIAGRACVVTLTREDNGYAYTVRQKTGFLHLLIAQGWTAGSQTEGLVEAREHAARALAR